MIMEPQIVYFLGIGGIGMSSLARYYHSLGVQVFGYDKTPSAITESLSNSGIGISFDDSLEGLPEVMMPGHSRNNVLVIYTPAIPAKSSLLRYFQNNGFELIKRAKALGLISAGKKAIAVAGTHGKTTTSSLVTHILVGAKKETSAFIGGISTNYQTNYISTGNDILVLEADEYDRSFLHLFPSTAIITSMDADHLDIYGTADELTNSYHAFASQVVNGGNLFTHFSLNFQKIEGVNCFTYGPNGDFSPENIRVENGKFVFDLKHPNGLIKSIKAGLPGRHNIDNAVGAMAACMANGVSDEDAKLGVETYLGVKRRFEYRLIAENHVYIDDYAHHPSEIEAFLGTIKELYPDKKMVGVFQPHLFTRTRDFADGFAQSLSLLDTAILLPIYPAREEPIDGINSQLLLDKITSPEKHLFSKEEVLDFVKQQKPALFLSIGAGDIDRLCDSFTSILKQNA